MQLLRQDDPRSPLEKAWRWELVKYARENGLSHITEDMPAPLIRNELRRMGLTQIKVPNRSLGLYAGGDAVTDSSAVEVNADEDLARQYARQVEIERKAKDLLLFPMNHLRRMCKERGIKMNRKETAESLRQKLGQDTP